MKQDVAAAEEQPPVGILLCSDRNHAKVEYATVGLDNNGKPAGPRPR